MPAYNCEAFLTNSIYSVINQSYKDWELLICDDCSTDSTKSVINNFSAIDNRIKYYCTPYNGGPALARNIGIKNAQGRFIAFLDSDDLWTSDKLEKQLFFMKKNNIAFSCTNYSVIDENGNETGELRKSPLKVDYNKMLYMGCPIGNLTVIYDTKKVGKIYAPIIKKRNDFALWLRILKLTDFCFTLNENLAKYRIRKDSISANKKSLFKHNWHLYYCVEDLGLFRSCLAISSWGLIKSFHLLKRFSIK